MQHRLIPRLFLSLLLIWQLSAGVFVHAHAAHEQPAQPEHMSMDHGHMGHDAMHESMHEPTHEHCAETLPNTHAHQDSDDHSSHESPNKCCGSVTCDCPCAHAVALMPLLPVIASAVPAATPVQFNGVIRESAGFSGQFRPPI